MKVLLQRVSRAAVRVNGVPVSSIGRGVLALVGVEAGDRDADASYLADKTAELRIFSDDRGKMNLGLLEVRGEALVVSQFTLAASTRRGRRPSFSSAAAPEEAERLYRAYAERLASRGVRVETGRFQETMEVELVNEGPVTVLLDPRPDPERP